MPSSASAHARRRTSRSVSDGSGPASTCVHAAEDGRVVGPHGARAGAQHAYPQVPCAARAQLRSDAPDPVVHGPREERMRRDEVVLEHRGELLIRTRKIPNAARGPQTAGGVPLDLARRDDRLVAGPGRVAARRGASRGDPGAGSRGGRAARSTVTRSSERTPGSVPRPDGSARPGSRSARPTARRRRRLRLASRRRPRGSRPGARSVRQPSPVRCGACAHRRPTSATSATSARPPPALPPVPTPVIARRASRGRAAVARGAARPRRGARS